MKNNGLVSVIIPTHNRGELMARAVRSVTRQTYSNWELIIVNDNSSDNTEEAVKPFLVDPRIRYFRLEQGAGGAGARNIGIENAAGDYLAFLDDDDEWVPEKLDKQIPLFEQHPDACIISCNFSVISAEGKIRNGTQPESISIDDQLFENVCGSFSFCVVRRELLGANRLDTNLKIAQDWDFWLKILISSGSTCFAHRDRLVNYYTHTSSRLTTSQYDSYRSFLLFLRKYFPRMSGSQKLYNLAYLQYFKYFASNSGLKYKLALTAKAVRLLFGSGRPNAKKLILILSPIFKEFLPV